MIGTLLACSIVTANLPIALTQPALNRTIGLTLRARLSKPLKPEVQTTPSGPAEVEAQTPRSPIAAEKGPLLVHVGYYIESLGNFDAVKMSFAMDIYLYMSWTDSAKAHTEKTVKMINNPAALKKSWVPDLYFANAQVAENQDVTVPNFVALIHQDGTVSYSSRVTLTIACNLNLASYPMDNQVCGPRMMSCKSSALPSNGRADAHSERTMKVRWFSELPIEMNQLIDLPEFEVVGSAATYCNGTYRFDKTEKYGHSVARYSCLLGLLYLRRSVGYHMVQSYIPTALIVIISWLSFWIEPSAVPARISLTFTTLLTLSTMGAGLRYSLPPVSYAKAIDFWIGMCLMSVFGSLLEFAVVNQYMRRAKKAQSAAPSAMDGSALSSLLVQAIAVENRSNEFARKAMSVDRFCRVAFPAFFLIFNVVYWSHYGVASGFFSQLHK